MAGNHTSCKQWGVLGQTKKSKTLQTNRKLLEADKERWEKARIASVDRVLKRRCRERYKIRKGQNKNDLNTLFLKFNEYPPLKYLN